MKIIKAYSRLQVYVLDSTMNVEHSPTSTYPCLFDQWTPNALLALVFHEKRLVFGRENGIREFQSEQR